MSDITFAELALAHRRALAELEDARKDRDDAIADLALARTSAEHATTALLRLRRRVKAMQISTLALFQEAGVTEYPRTAATSPSTSRGMVPKAAKVEHTQTEGPPGLVCVKVGRPVPKKKRPSSRAKR